MVFLSSLVFTILSKKHSTFFGYFVPDLLILPESRPNAKTESSFSV
ncbi:hypothetical protein RV07_GL003961 [Enterococcus malodoratus]|nr:hypothetical protein RV07_GL003961 [Enterococcus malodoratus]